MARFDCDLLAGDVTTWHAEGFVGTAITLRTGGDRSHAEITVLIEGEPWSAGAHSSGIVAAPIENYVRQGARLRVLRAPEDAGPPGWRERLWPIIKPHVGVVDYSYRWLLLNALPRWVFGNVDPEDVPAEMMCSQAVSFYLRLATARYSEGLAGGWWDPCPEWADRLTTPDDLDKHSLLVPVCDELAIVEGTTATG